MKVSKVITTTDAMMDAFMVANHINHHFNAEKNTAYMPLHINQTKPKHAGNSGAVKEGKKQSISINKRICYFMLSLFCYLIPNTVYCDIIITPSFYYIPAGNSDLNIEFISRGISIEGGFGYLFFDNNYFPLPNLVSEENYLLYFSTTIDGKENVSNISFGLGLEHNIGMSLSRIYPANILVGSTFRGGWYSIGEGKQIATEISYLADGIRTGNSVEHHIKYNWDYDVSIGIYTRCDYISERHKFGKQFVNDLVQGVIPGFIICLAAEAFRDEISHPYNILSKNSRNNYSSRISILLVGVARTALLYGYECYLEKNKPFPFQNVPRYYSIKSYGINLSIRL